MKKCIVYKTHSFPEYSETFVTNSMIQAIESGYKVSIVVDTLNSIYKSSQKELIKNYKLLEKAQAFSQPLSKNRRLLGLLMLFFRPKLFIYYLKYIKQKGKQSLDYVFYLIFYNKYRKASVFHVHYSTAIEPLIALKKIGFIKGEIIITYHGYDAFTKPNKEVLNAYIKNANIYVKTITVNSEYLKKQLIRKGFKSNMISIVPIGVDTSYYTNNNRKPYKEEEALQLVSIGRLILLKGHRYGIQVIDQLIKDGINVNYTIVGDGEQLEELSELVKNLKLEDNIHFVGAKNQLEIKDILAASHLFLMTSTYDEKDRREAFGLVSLEAQSMGVPVIGFNSGGFPETIIEGKTGYIVKDRDIEAMVNRIKYLLNNKAEFYKMSKNAPIHVKKKFDISSDKTSYTKFYS